MPLGGGVQIISGGAHHPQKICAWRHMGEKVAYCNCHIFKMSFFPCFYYEHIINFVPGKFQQILIS